MSDLYDTDVAAWAEQQAGALRRRAANEIDWDNVAEEIADVAASQKREIRRRLRVICEHLLKWRHHRQRRWWAGHGWRKTLTEQRRRLQDLFEDSPSLRRFASAAMQPAFANARQDVEQHVGSLALSDDVCPWSLEQILSIDFPPGD
jgi:hypothetical protein